MLWNSLATIHLLRRGLASSHWPAQKLREWQWQRLRRVLIHAYQRVPMYRELYDRAGFHPCSLRSIGDIGRVPVLTKDRLRTTAPQNRLAQGMGLDDCRVIATSGSSGSPLQLYFNAADQRWQRATAWRVLFEHGYRLSDRTMEIRVIFGDRFFIQSLGVARKDWLSLLDPPSSWLSHLERTRPEVLVAGASTLAALAEACSGNQPTHRPRLIFSDSEPLTPTMRDLIRRRLGSDPIDMFGLAELSNFAWQCEKRAGFHISADSHLVEVDDNGAMVVTDLGLWGAPMVRYHTGDHAEWEPLPCSCGRSLPHLRQIHGRAIESIVLPSGRRVFWPFFHEVLGAFSEIRQWRVVAPPGQTPLVQLAAEPTVVPVVRRALVEAVPEASDWAIEALTEIPRRPGNKQPLVLTTP